MIFFRNTVAVVLAPDEFSVYCHLLQIALRRKSFVTTVALVALASCAVAALVLVVRRTAVRLRGTADGGSISVSRQWLIQHQSNDHL